jgi:hypothetical protein
MILHITDHAVLRYLERVHGVDTEMFRTAIRHEIGASAAVGVVVGGPFSVKTATGVYVCNGANVVTVLRPGARMPLRADLLK